MRRLAPWLAIASWLAAAAAPGRADEGPPPLPPGQAAIFQGSAADSLDTPLCDQPNQRATAACREQITYVKTNELAHHAWKPYVERIGGAYVGVGSDQGLTFVAWARSELAWLIDYDPKVVLINLIHRALLLHSDDAEAFFRAWAGDARGLAAAEAALRAEYQEPVLRRALELYRHRALTVWEHLRRMRRLGAGGLTPRHWLSDAGDYRYVRQLFERGRIRVLGGDLLKPVTLTGIGRAAAQLGVPVRVLYLSNAEENWAYTPTFRDNMAALPVDDRSVVLRTCSGTHYGPRLDGKFVYVVQGGRDFQARLRDPSDSGGVARMMAHRTPGPRGLVAIGIAPRQQPIGPLGLCWLGARRTGSCDDHPDRDRR